MELDWRGLAAAFKSTPADVILGGAPGALLDIQLSAQRSWHNFSVG